MGYGTNFTPSVTYSLPKLREAIAWSRCKMQPFREVRLMFVREFAGSLYGQMDAKRRKVPYNLLAQDVETYSRALISTNPQLLISTFNPQLRGEAKLIETAVNRRLLEIRWQETLQDLAMDFCFCMSVAKIGVCQENGQNITYIDTIDLDDLIIDMTARCISDVAYIGHKMRKPLQEVLANQSYNQEALSELTPSPRRMQNERGDAKITTVTNSDTNSEAEPVQMVDICEVYIPSQRRLITAAFKDGLMSITPLLDEAYVGPPHGPYEICGASKIPGNLIPLSPVAQLFDLHDAINHITAKIIRDAENHKKFNVAQKGNTDDATRVMNEINGGFCFLDNPASITEMEMRGVNKADIAVLMQLNEMQNKMAGNVDVMAGLQSDAGTLGQENLLAANSSKLIMSMQEKMQGFVTRIGRAVAWHVFNEAKQQQIAVAYKMGSLDTVQSLIPQGDFEDYDFQVNPYSMQDMTPQKVMQVLDSTVTTVMVPMAPVMAAQGKMFDVGAYLAIKAKMMNTPQIEEMVIDMPTPQMGMGGDGGGGEQGPSMPQRGPSKPPATTRSYVRHSKGGAQAGKKAAMASMLAESAA